MAEERKLRSLALKLSLNVFLGGLAICVPRPPVSR